MRTFAMESLLNIIVHYEENQLLPSPLQAPPCLALVSTLGPPPRPSSLLRLHVRGKDDDVRSIVDGQLIRFYLHHAWHRLFA